MQNKKLNLLLVAIFGATLIGCNGGSDGGGGDNPPTGLSLSLDTPSAVKTGTIANATILLNNASSATSNYNVTLSLSNNTVMTESPVNQSCVLSKSVSSCVIKLYAGSVGEVSVTANTSGLNAVSNRIIVSTDPAPEPSGLNLKGKYVLSGPFGAVTNKKLMLTNNVSADIDGDGWNEMPLGATSINNFVYAKDRFVTAGGQKYFYEYDKAGFVSLFSDDGINWYKTKSIQPFYINGDSDQGKIVSECFSNNSGVSIPSVYFDSNINKYVMPCADSSDGISWSYVNNHGFVPAISGLNRYLSFGTQYDKGYYSVDGGLQWMQMSSSPVAVPSNYSNSNSYGFYFNGSQFISSYLATLNTYSSGLRYSTEYKISSDGSNWNTQSMPIILTDNVFQSFQIGCSIVQANNKFFCGFNLGDNSSDNAYQYIGVESRMVVAISNNGTSNWASSTVTLSRGAESVNYSTLQYVNNQYFADCSKIGYGNAILPSYKVCSSSDGINWQYFANSPSRIDNLGYYAYSSISTKVNRGMRNLTYLLGKYFLFGDNGKVYYSTDNMQTWTQTVSGITVSNYNTFKDTTGLSFILGRTSSEVSEIGSTDPIYQTTIAYSTDNAASFKMATVPTLDKTPRSIATSGSDYVVVGDAGTLLHSTDGKTWTQVNISNLTTSDLTTIRYINGTYYAVGDLGYVLTSTNGTTWSATQVSANPRLMDIVYDNSKFFVVGYGGYIGYSSNATNWIRATTPNKNQVNALAFGSGKYIAVGNGGVLWTSTNGIQWNEVSAESILNIAGLPISLSTYNINSIVYDAQDGFVAVGNNGLIMKSADGVAWTVGNSSDDSYEDITQLN
jgi:photosystem II stability/assembly factor-like uncharacterized protein